VLEERYFAQGFDVSVLGDGYDFGDPGDVGIHGTI
jgi:hypothetical protein